MNWDASYISTPLFSNDFVKLLKLRLFQRLIDWWVFSKVIIKKLYFAINAILAFAWNSGFIEKEELVQ